MVSHEVSRVVCVWSWALTLAGLFLTPLGQAAEAPKPAVLTALPQDHEYQRVLRGYLATLTEADFAHGVTALIGPKEGPLTPDEQYRNHIYTMSPQPLVGSKRGTPAINAPPRLYTLAQIETPKGVLLPPGYAEATISLVQWRYPGNPYYDNRALKMRTFVGSVVNLLMIDHYLDQNPLSLRTDRMSYFLVRTGAAWPAFKDLLPPAIQQAFRDGTRKLAERLLALPPKGEEANLDMMAPVGLGYAARVLDDAAFTQRVTDYARRQLADPQYLHPAGFWLERGGLDISFSGTTNYFAIWAALADDWDFAKEAVAKVYRLRSHLLLPEPTGGFTGPTQFNNRTSGSCLKDQWDYPNRDAGAAMITDEAGMFITPPTPEQLAGGGAQRAAEFGRQIAENPQIVSGQNVFQANEAIISHPWAFGILPSYNFPASVNPAFEFYRQGALARVQALVAAGSPMLKSPFLRGEHFIRDFGGAFIVARQPSYAAIVHAGPVGEQNAADGLFQFNSPMGFGGGQLAAFWTPATGSVLLGRRGGQHWDKPFDLVSAWRTWPLHAVSGQTTAGIFLTSARIAQPVSKVTTTGAETVVTVSGALPSAIDGQPGQTAGKYSYQREFRLSATGVAVTSSISGDGSEALAELYETLPIFLNDPQVNGTADPKTTIEFQVAGAWVPGAETASAGVQALRVTRFGGTMLVAFDRPRRVKLAATPWTDAFLTRASCRTVLIDLMETGDQPLALKEAKTISYTITAAKP